MTFEKVNKKPIPEAFKEFDEANPIVFEMFCLFAIQWINKQLSVGKKLEQTKLDSQQVKISAKQVCGRIRWWSSVEIISNTEYKINDAYTAHYARKFIAKYPQYTWPDKSFDSAQDSIRKCVFEMRELRGKKQGELFRKAG